MRLTVSALIIGAGSHSLLTSPHTPSMAQAAIRVGSPCYPFDPGIVPGLFVIMSLSPAVTGMQHE